MAFNRDMILLVPLLADRALIHNHRQVMINEQYHCASLKSYSFDYQPGQQVFLHLKTPSKLGKQSTGP
jgi:hypothetical protein